MSLTVPRAGRGGPDLTVELFQEHTQGAAR
ncbi:MAG: hypothetical protein JWO42_4110 [Chloroflexi bacterium]|nr:hypothetical protein [Chloroflexota bacterium]